MSPRTQARARDFPRDFQRFLSRQPQENRRETGTIKGEVRGVYSKGERPDNLWLSNDSNLHGQAAGLTVATCDHRGWRGVRNPVAD
jgi:hypothetical protein